MRVVVTGLGAISCLGRGMTAHRQALHQGRSGIGPIGNLRPDLPVQAWAGVVNPRESRWNDDARAPALLAHVVAEALAAASLQPRPGMPLFIGTAHGNLGDWQRWRLADPTRPLAPWDELGARLEPLLPMPRVTTISTACTASAVAAGLAWGLIRSGQTDVALVTGVEVLTPFLYHGFESLRSLAPGNCRPFDRQRAGLVLGEGAAALVLESQAHARQRGARALAELCGYGFASDAAALTAPDPRASGATAALRQALAHAELDTGPDFINLHGTGTALNDRMECVALQRVFGDEAAGIALTSTKPMTGHLCGAAGAIEIALTIASLDGGTIPPILGFESPDSESAHLDFVHGANRPWRRGVAMSLNSGFGGTNTTLVLRKEAP